MRDYEQELARALRLAEALADPVRTQNSRERWLRALGWQETDRPPLMIQLPSVTCLPPPWNEFAPVPYRAGCQRLPCRRRSALRSGGLGRRRRGRCRLSPGIEDRLQKILPRPLAKQSHGL